MINRFLLLLALLPALAFGQVNVDTTKTGIVLPGSPILSSTWTALPSASSVAAGTRYRASDIGSAPGIVVVSDGTRWKPDGAQTIAASAIPIILTPTGSMGNNGSVTVGTALPAVYPSAYMHFPANAIAAGSAAGLYYTSMSSTTTGTVYNTPYTGGIPSIPTSTVSFSTTGPGAFTAVTTTVTLSTITIPGGLMGVNGSLEIESLWTANNNANAKTPSIAFGASDMFPSSLTSVVSGHDKRIVTNRGSASSQFFNASGAQGGWGTTTGASGYIAVNTAADVQITIKAQKATATDYIVLEGFSIRVSP